METVAVLLVDADNAFNRLNREVALHNIQYTCPPLATILGNIYRVPSRLFVGTPPLVAAVSSLAISSRGHLVASHFVAGALRRQTFRRGDTSSPVVFLRGHFVDG